MFFLFAAFGTITRVCGLKIWILQKLKWQKNFRRYGHEKNPSILEVWGKDEIPDHNFIIIWKENYGDVWLFKLNN